jgi:hypothetical protein
MIVNKPITPTIDLAATWYLFTMYYFEQVVTFQPRCEISGNLLYVQFSADLMAFQEKHRIYAKLPGRPAFYRALSCFFNIKMNDLAILPHITKKSRGIVLMHLGLNFDNLDVSKISPVESDEVDILVNNGILPPWFSGSRQHHTFDHCFCGALQTSSIRKEEKLPGEFH